MSNSSGFRATAAAVLVVIIGGALLVTTESASAAPLSAGRAGPSSQVTQSRPVRDALADLDAAAKETTDRSREGVAVTARLDTAAGSGLPDVIKWTVAARTGDAPASAIKAVDPDSGEEFAWMGFADGHYYRLLDRFGSDSDATALNLIGTPNAEVSTTESGTAGWARQLRPAVLLGDLDEAFTPVGLLATLEENRTVTSVSVREQPDGSALYVLESVDEPGGLADYLASARFVVDDDGLLVHARAKLADPQGGAESSLDLRLAGFGPEVAVPGMPAASLRVESRELDRAARRAQVLLDEGAEVPVLPGDDVAPLPPPPPARRVANAGDHFATRVPRPRKRWIVTVGDSFISGEGGRFAGNFKNLVSGARADALGGGAYDDRLSRGFAPIGDDCHRSVKSPVQFDSPGVGSLNLACSGALSVTTGKPADKDFKPGLDFYHEGDAKGQALLLQEFARGRNVSEVDVSIGGNDFGFSTIIKTCMASFWVNAGAPEPAKLARDGLNYLWDKVVGGKPIPQGCADLSSIKDKTASWFVGHMANRIAAGVANVRKALDRAGSAATIVVHTYPKILNSTPPAVFRDLRGCPFTNGDWQFATGPMMDAVNRAVRTAVSGSDPRVQLLDIADLFAGLREYRLCSTDVGMVGGDKGPDRWDERGAIWKSEWVAQIRTVTAITSSAALNEAMHPNYWGQAAIRSCMRQVFARTDSAGLHPGARCTLGAAESLNAHSEPVTVLSGGGRP